MRNWRRRRDVIVGASLFAIFLTTILVRAFWISHDSSHLLRDIAASFGIMLFAVLFTWYGEGRRYFKILVYSLQVVFWGGFSIRDAMYGSRFLSAISALVCIGNLAAHQSNQRTKVAFQVSSFGQCGHRKVVTFDDATRSTPFRG